MRYAVPQNESRYVALNPADGYVWNREIFENDVTLQDFPQILVPK